VHPDDVATILRALLSNAADAVQASPAGSERRIIVRTDAAIGGSIDLCVEDTGVGMSPATQGRIFEPFFSTKGARGVGLSLGVTKKIAETYGGFVKFTSEENKGSAFVVRLPLSTS
jgi:signal transduction histidine kinase